MRYITKLLSLLALVAIWTGTTIPATAETDRESPTGTSDFAHYHTLEAELAGLIAQRRAVDKALETERRQIVTQARSGDVDPRDALLVWRGDRSRQFQEQDALGHEIMTIATAMQAFLIEYNNVVDPGPEATESERDDYRELVDQIRFAVIETLKQHEREAARLSIELTSNPEGDN